MAISQQETTSGVPLQSQPQAHSVIELEQSSYCSGQNTRSVVSYKCCSVKSQNDFQALECRIFLLCCRHNRWEFGDINTIYNTKLQHWNELPFNHVCQRNILSSLSYSKSLPQLTSSSKICSILSWLVARSSNEQPYDGISRHWGYINYWCFPPTDFKYPSCVESAFPAFCGDVLHGVTGNGVSRFPL